MKKQLTICAAALIALAMTGCETKGDVEGVVMDPFTGKAVEMPTVWMDSTVFSTQKEKYEFKAELKNGTFKFVGVPAGDYLIKTRRNKYVLGQQRFSTTAENPNAKLTLYSYSDQVKPGLYKEGAAESADKVDAAKINNEHVLFSATCKESIAGYRQTMPNTAKDAKKGSTVDLPAPTVVDAAIKVIYQFKSSVTVPVEASVFPAVVAPVASHKDCSGFDAKDKNGVFAKADAGTKLNVAYLAEGLFEISGTLPQGKQILQISQEGKTLQTYYFEVK